MRFLLVIIFSLVFGSQIFGQNQITDCGIFLFRADFEMFPIGKWYSFEIRNDCDGDFFMMTQKDLNIYEKINVTGNMIPTFLKLLNGVSEKDFKDLDNPYLLDGMLITLTCIYPNEKLIKCVLHLPANPNEFEQQKTILDYFLEMIKQSFEQERINPFFRYLDWYYKF